MRSKHPEAEAPTNALMSNTQIDANFLRELAEIEVESIGWIPLAEGAYLHVSSEDVTEVLVVGVPQAGVAVLLVG